MKQKVTILLFAIFIFGTAYTNAQNYSDNALSVLGKSVNTLKSGNNVNGKEIADEWKHWDDGQNSNAVGLTDGGSFTVAARWTGNQLIAFNGDKVTKVKFFISSTSYSSLVLKIWKGANASNLIYQKQITNIVANSWNEVTLPTNITIDASQEFWVGYSITGQQASQFPAGADSGPATTGFGDMITFDENTWDPLSTLNPNLNYNWNIQFYVESQSSAVTANFTASSTNITTGQSVQFNNTSTGSTSWSWEFEGGSPSTSTLKNPTVTYPGVGTFYVKLIAKNGSSQDVELRNNYIIVTSAAGPLEVEITADPGTSICEFGSTVLTAVASGGTGNYQYTWTWDIDGQIITGNTLSISNLALSAEVYLTVKSGGQQIDRTTIITVNDNPPASIVGKGNPNKILICPHPDLEYQWFVNNSEITGAQKQFYYPGESSSLAGVYYVLTTNQNGCNSYSANYTVSSDKTTANDNSVISIYPNPSDGAFLIDLDPELIVSEIDTYNIVIYSATGVKVWESLFDATFTTNISPEVDLLPGYYILKLYGNNQLFDTKKILVN